MNEVVKQGGEYSGWRILFIALEVRLAFAWLCAICDEYLLPRFSPWSTALEWVAAPALWISWPVLFLVAPLFLRKLKRIALVGWLMAFGFVVWGLFLPALS